MDTIFRTKAEVPPVAPNTPTATSEPAPSIVHNVPVPYNDAPDFLEHYFGLGTEWKDQDASFYPEIEKIDGYLRDKIEAGELPNDQKAVRALLKRMSRMNNLHQESRSVVKLEVLANYVEFLEKNDNLKSNLRRYGRAY